MIKKKCSNILCNNMIPRSKRNPYCEEHESSNANNYYNKNRTAREKQLYSSSRWRRFRLTVLKEYHYLCQAKLDGCNVTADTVHHLVEVKEDWTKRFDRDNAIPICRSCHNMIHG